MQPNSRWPDWLKQAVNQFAWAKDAHDREQYALCCFLCQQAAEMGLKALAYFKGANLVKGHSALAIANNLEINGPVREASQRLDQYYITTRYPDAVATGAPFEYFTKAQSEEALEFAALILENVKAKTTKV